MWHRASDMCLLLVLLPAAVLAWLSVAALPLTLLHSLPGHPSPLTAAARLGEAPQSPGPATSPFTLAKDGTRITLPARAAPDPRLLVFPAGGKTPLLGRTERLPDLLIFHPALPFVPGQCYTVEWIDHTGAPRQTAFELPSPQPDKPTVQMQPTAPLPANALRFYLHFSQPMEQGIFLDRLRLLDADGTEIIGPFRETELWSPDGTRLTVWLHPGRQKTGVNLQQEEGPVLRPDQPHTLVISGAWRSATGLPIGSDVRLPLTSIAADHQRPELSRWKFSLPQAGTRDPLLLHFDEPLDTAMLSTALRLSRSGAPLPLTITVSKSGLQWSATPGQPWQSGTHTLHADPLLEDLAGNNLARPFEIDLQAAEQTPPVLSLEFVIQ